MADVNLNGIGVALVTPFKKDYSIDYEALDKLLDHLMKGYCDYFVILGTTAETPTLSLDEKLMVTRFVKEKIGGRIPLVLGIGGNNTMGIVKDIQTRDLDGYSAILSVAPYYNKPTQEGLYQHFKTICDNSPLPIVLYNVPSRTGVNISAKTTLRLADYSPKIAGIKEASGNLEQIEEIIKNSDDNFAVISGNDSDTFPLMRMGAKGVISVLGNAFPKEVKHLYNLCVNRKYEEAESFQRSLNPIIGSLFEDGNPAGVKALLSHMGILENVLRLPLIPVSAFVESKLKKEAGNLSNL